MISGKTKKYKEYVAEKIKQKQGAAKALKAGKTHKVAKAAAKLAAMAAAMAAAAAMARLAMATGLNDGGCDHGGG